MLQAWGDACEGFPVLTLGQWEALEGTSSPLKKNQAFPKKQALSPPVRRELVTKLCADLPICLEQCFSNVLKQSDPLFFPSDQNVTPSPYI